ncbi:MAG TPA: YbaB/EbfC family nucleoid-associated protein [Chloroflexota bacterium]
MQQMQQRLEKAQEELGNEIVEGTAGGGAVTIRMNGHRQVQSVKIDPAAVDPDDVETLEEMILSAFGDASAKAEQLTAQRMGALTGGLKIPGLT